MTVGALVVVGATPVATRAFDMFSGAELWYTRPANAVKLWINKFNPNDSIGLDGDLWLNTTTSELFRKEERWGFELKTNDPGRASVSVSCVR